MERSRVRVLRIIWMVIGFDLMSLKATKQDIILNLRKKKRSLTILPFTYCAIRCFTSFLFCLLLLLYLRHRLPFALPGLCSLSHLLFHLCLCSRYTVIQRLECDRREPTLEDHHPCPSHAGVFEDGERRRPAWFLQS